MVNSAKCRPDFFAEMCQRIKLRRNVVKYVVKYVVKLPKWWYILTVLKLLSFHEEVLKPVIKSTSNFMFLFF